MAPSMMQTLESVQGCKVVEIKFHKESKTTHQLLWKQHIVRTYDEHKPAERTLFVVNVPPYATESAFKKVFSRYGKVLNVQFYKKPTSGAPQLTKFPNLDPVQPVTGFKVAYVVFSSPASVQKAMAKSSTVLTLSSQENSVPSGIKKWSAMYNNSFVSKTVLAKEIQNVMEDFDQRKEAEKSGNTDPDEDGWVTVINTKKKPRQIKVDELKQKRSRKKKKQQQLVNFYGFQERQTKMDHLAQLRKKFEEDKKRISQMRASRKFRPY
ncbi:ribosomal RNA-processing protein 7 homolog A-like isoform X2 [Penaeus japonicus]|uniref:ribosomal RNA-processing protein 7 homolog A-like isoform X2 n=1 Tax=Penaeus japonicus TaxID=27405 RepID=UPI001C717B6C|nr:ribosomal RNA-processing protein 7 homolog A-like isoform X2 [Penaeus japonicus]